MLSIPIYILIIFSAEDIKYFNRINTNQSVKTVNCDEDFMWTMEKITLVIDQSLESNTSWLSFYKRLLADIEEKPIEGKTKYVFEDIILPKLKYTKSTVKDLYQKTISEINNTMNDRFGDISGSPVFT